MLGRIFNIQRYSLHDGNGIRTVVFLKGCPLSCPWCSNPESRSPKIQYIRREQQCLHCTQCTHSVEECPSGAYQQVGEDMTVEQVVAQCKRDAVFYKTSQGGVTLSGGEVLAQAPFATALLTRLQAAGFRTAIETTGHGGRRALQRLATVCDEILYDLKIMDPQQAQSVAGINSELVLSNFTMLVQQGFPVIPRVPLIPGYTLTDDNLRSIIGFLQSLAISTVHLLPFHQLGEGKYDLLDMPYTMRTVPVLSDEEVAATSELFTAAGFTVSVGG